MRMRVQSLTQMHQKCHFTAKHPFSGPIAVGKCEWASNISPERTQNVIISRQITQTLVYFTQQCAIRISVDKCEWGSNIWPKCAQCVIIWGQIPKILDYFTQMCNLDFSRQMRTRVQYLIKMHPMQNVIISSQMPQTLDYRFTQLGLQ